jgi:predicted DNA-binding protein
MAKPISVKLDGPLLARIKALSDSMGEAQSTIMRIAIRVGLDGLEKLFAEGADAKAIASLAYPPHRAESAMLNELEKPKPKKKPPGTHTE